MIPSRLLVAAYASGWFPMASEGEIRWYSPDPRGILPLDQVHIPRRLARVARTGRFRIEVDRAFVEVMRACAADERDREDPGTWIDDEIIESYTALHEAGIAHSVETWIDDRLVGGLYGVALGGAFFGESMFHHETDASKVALGDTQVLGLEREKLESLLTTHPVIVYRVMRAIIRVVHQIQRRLSMQQAELSNYIYKQHGRY